MRTNNRDNGEINARLAGMTEERLRDLCTLAHLLGASQSPETWGAHTESKRRYLGRVAPTLVPALVDFAGVASALVVPEVHEDRVEMIPSKIASRAAATLWKGRGTSDGTDDFENADLCELLTAKESRLLLRWSIFEHSLPHEQRALLPSAVNACAERSANTSLSKSNRRRRAARNGGATAAKVGWGWFSTALGAVVGLEDVKRALYEDLYIPLVRPEVAARFGLGGPSAVLMHGAPGLGKTALARELAERTGLEFRYVAAPELLIKWVGDTEAAIRKAFAPPEGGRGCILFLDELDAIAPNRDAVHNGVSAHVAQLLVLLDGFRQRTGVGVIAATNRLEAIDPAIVRSGRFHPIEVRAPSLEDRRKIFEVHLKGRDIGAGLDLAGLTAESEGWSGADLKAVCDAAARRAMHRELETSLPQFITQADLDEALEAHRAGRAR